jgi:hypothetical protein
VKNFFGKWGPLILTGVWMTVAFVAVMRASREGMIGGAFFWGTSGFFVGVGGVLVFLALKASHRMGYPGRAKINIWSSARPGEVLVGVLHTGIPGGDPKGIVIHLDCLETTVWGQWRLWTAEVRSPAPSAPDTWPFHFSIPTEGPPSGWSPSGTVLWQLRVQGASRSDYWASFDIPVLKVEGPASHVLPVPPPSLRFGSGPRRMVSVSEADGRTILRLKSRFVFPGPNPIVIWVLSIVGILFISTRVTIPVWVLGTWGILNGLAAVCFSILWFGREELILSPAEIVCRRAVGPLGYPRRFRRSSVTGIRVSFSGPAPSFGVHVDRGTQRPVAVFDGFIDLLEAHEAARVVNRAIGSTKLKE